MKIIKNKLVLVLSIIGLVLIVTGITLALLSINLLGIKEQVINVGKNFNFSYNEPTNALTLDEDNVLSDNAGKTQSDYFDFNVSLTANETVNYYIYLTIDSTSTISNTAVNVYLTDQSNTQIVAPKSVAGLISHETYTNSYYLYGKSITSSGTTVTQSYRLRVWVDEDKSYYINEGDGVHTLVQGSATYKFTVNVATGVIETPTLSSSYLTYVPTLDKDLTQVSFVGTVDLTNAVTFNSATSFDLSSGQDNTVTGWIESDGGTGYILKISAGDGKRVYAPNTSSHLFDRFDDVENYTKVSSVTSINFNNYFDTTLATNMSSMFGSSIATSIDVSSFNTSNVTDMSYMFTQIHATSLDLSSFDTSNVTDMSSMLSGSLATSIDASSFDTSNVTDMSYMFSSIQDASLDLSNFDTSKVTNMSHMFDGGLVTSLDLSSFDTSKVTNMSNMFKDSLVTSLDLSSFITTNVTNMQSMFESSKVTSLDLSSFDMSGVTYKSMMLYNVTTLTSAYAKTSSDATILNNLKPNSATYTFVVK